MQSSLFKCGLAACINKRRVTATELSSKYTFFKLGTLP